MPWPSVHILPVWWYRCAARKAGHVLRRGVRDCSGAHREMRPSLRRDDGTDASCRPRLTSNLGYPVSD